MNSKLKSGMFFGAILLCGMVYLHPIFRDQDAGKSIKLYVDYLLGREADIAPILGEVDFACAVGPYDTFVDSRFKGVLSATEIKMAENPLKEVTRDSLGSIGIFLVGFKNHEMVKTYRSNYFANAATLQPRDGASKIGLDCGKKIHVTRVKFKYGESIAIVLANE